MDRGEHVTALRGFLPGTVRLTDSRDGRKGKGLLKCVCPVTVLMLQSISGASLAFLEQDLVKLGSLVKVSTGQILDTTKRVP